MPSPTLSCRSRTTLYRTHIVIINRQRLSGRANCVWTERLAGHHPHWRTLYKSPIRKWTGDLWWGILHGAIATNSYLSPINPAVEIRCPFCGLPETVFHIFRKCGRLETRSVVFNWFCVLFSFSVFNAGVGLCKTQKSRCQPRKGISGK